MSLCVCIYIYVYYALKRYQIILVSFLDRVLEM